MPIGYAIGLAVACALGGGLVAYALLLTLERFRLAEVTRRVTAVLEQADRDAEAHRKRALLDAREQALAEREKLLSEVEKTRAELHRHERELERREERLRSDQESLRKHERTLEFGQRKASEALEQCNRRQAALDRTYEEQRDILQKITGLDKIRAKQLLLDRLEGEFEEELGARILAHEQNVRESCAERTRELILAAIQRYAADHTTDSTCATIDIPGDDMKGRIIGREGRNIRAFEKATGVDVIVDDTPGIVVVSAFDNVRREIAKVALQRLIADGRIHPARIEEVVTKTKAEIDAHVVEVGRKAAREADIGRIDEKLIELLGRLKFRTSYSQNVLQHSLEVAFLSGAMAEELGMDGTLARRCGLLHDVGKAADHEVEGGHPQVGADIARRCGEKEIVVHAIEHHHDDIKVDFPYTALIAAADAISASRPGARRETLEKYVKRLEELEALACNFTGVESAYAIQAGREIRVIADAKRTTDKSAAKVARDIARAIEDRLQYPGEIKVTVVRETRAMEIAR